MSHTRSARTASHPHIRTAALLLAAALAAAGAAGCARGSGVADDRFGAFNVLGGAARTNDFSRVSVPPASILKPFRFRTLSGGLMAPPLELAAGHLALVIRDDTAACLAVVYRDSVLWRHAYARTEAPLPGIAADSAGIIYSVSSRGMLHAFSPTGASLWTVPTVPDTPGTVSLPSPLLALTSGVVVGNSRGDISRYDRNGHLVWRATRGGSTNGIAAADPAIGIVVVATNNSFNESDTVVALDPASGAIRWAIPVAGRVVSGPAIANGNIGLGLARRGADGRRAPAMVVLTGAGKPAWSVPLDLMPRGIAADETGNWYVGCSGTSAEVTGSIVTAFDGTGRRRWTITLQSTIAAAPSISAERIYFIGRRDGRTGLYTYGRDGNFQTFVSIDLLPDVLAQTSISSFGELVLAARDEAAILEGE